MNSDIKFIILSKIFTNFATSTTFSTIVNYNPQIVCTYFGGMCEYCVKTRTDKGYVVKKILNHIIPTDLKDYTGIICICESFTILMFNNPFARETFTILIFDDEALHNKITLYPFHINGLGHSPIKISFVLIDYWLTCIDNCTIMYHSDAQLSTNVKLLIEKIKRSIRLFESASQNNDYWPPNNLFY